MTLKPSNESNHSRFATNFSVRLVLLLPLFAAASAGAAEIDVRPAGGLSETELAVWNDPDFQKRFAESYIAETEIEPRVTVPERDTMQEILELISSGQLEEAAKKLERERNEASSAVFDFTLANIHFQRERLEEAAAHYRAAVEKYPKFLRAWKNLGIIHVRRGEFEQALPALTRTLELGGNDPIALGLLGFAYASVENHLAAESAYRMAILLDPDTLDWKLGLARSFFKQHRYAEAAAICGYLLEEYPDRGDFWLLQANAYIGMNQPMKAAGNYELADQLGKSTVESLNTLGDIYINEELYELAVDAYIRALDKGGGDAVSRPLRSANILAARGAYGETRRLLDRIEKTPALQGDPSARKDLLKLRARLAVAAGEGGGEARVLEEIVELDPLDGEALILLGQHHAREGDAEKAAFYFERAAAIEKYEADAKVRHAQLLVQNGEYAEALPLLRSTQRINFRENVQEYLEQVERAAKSR